MPTEYETELRELRVEVYADKRNNQIFIHSPAMIGVYAVPVLVVIGLIAYGLLPALIGFVIACTIGLGMLAQIALTHNLDTKLTLLKRHYKQE